MKNVKDTAMKTLVYAIAIISFVLIARNLFKPTPATAAYVLSHLATYLAFGYAYYKTKDKFLIMMFASEIPMLISDLYFLPSFGGIIWPKPGGMNTYAGIHLAVLAIGCFFYFRKSLPRYVIPFALVATLLTNWNFAGFNLSRSAVGVAVGLVLQSTVFGYLTYYGMQKKKLIFSLGAIIQLVGIFMAAFYFIFISKDLSPFALTWTDKIISSGRLLTAIGAL